MSLENSSGSMRTSSNSDCYICGTKGTLLYQELKDLLFKVPGEWNFKKCINPACGLVWLDPRPVEEDIGKAYQSYLTHEITTPQPTLIHQIHWVIRDGYLQSKYGYTQGVGSHWSRYLAPLAFLHPGGPEQLSDTAMYLSAPNNEAKLLEIGCGNGQRLSRMQTMGWNVEGLDVDPLAVKKAQSYGLSVRLGDLTSQNYPDNFFDAIYMSHVIEHLHHPLNILNECYRVLKPGGRLVMITPNTESWGHNCFNKYWRGLEPPRHLHLFNIQCIKTLVARADFTSEKGYTIAKAACYILMMSAKLKNSYLRGLDISKPDDIRLKIKAIFYQILERILLLIKPKAGEEILIIARK